MNSRLVWLLSSMLISVVSADAETKIEDPKHVQGFAQLGFGVLSDDSEKYGEYHGIDQKGIYGLFNASLLFAPHWAETDQTVFQWSWFMWGPKAYQMQLRYQDLGEFLFDLDYTTFEKSSTPTVYSIFSDVGSESLVLPSSWLANQTTAGFVLNDMTAFHLNKQRESLEVRFSRHYWDDWNFSVNAKQQNKKGTQALAGVIGNTGGNPRSVILPAPIDYRTNEFNFIAENVQEHHVARLAYSVSFFNNKDSALVWQNPYLAINGWNPSAGYPSGYGQMALPPDNRYQQLHGAWRYFIDESTFFDADLSLARMEQDEAFLPYTINPALTVSYALPQSSLNGQIDITKLKLIYHFQPSTRSAMDFSYRMEDRDNKTPMLLFQGVPGDSLNQSLALSSSRNRLNLPYDLLQHQMQWNTRYRLNTGHVFGARYQWTQNQRTYSEVSETKEHLVRLFWRPKFHEDWTANVQAEWSDRNGTDYRDQYLYLLSHTPEYLNTVPVDERFENHPLLRRFSVADKTRTQIKVAMAYAPVHWFNLSIMGAASDDQYNAQMFGLNERQVEQYHTDIGFHPHERWSFSFYYGLEQYQAAQSGRQFRGGGNLLLDANNVNRDWAFKDKNTVVFAGSSIQLKKVTDRSHINVDYFYSDAIGEGNTQVASGLSSAPLPDLRTRMNRLQLEWVMDYSRYWQWRFMWRHETLASNDWQVDNLTPQTLNNVLTLPLADADYTVDWLILSLRRQF